MLQEIRYKPLLDDSDKEDVLVLWASTVQSLPLLLLAVPQGAKLDAITVGRKQYKPADDIYWVAALLMYLLGASEIALETIVEALEEFLRASAQRVLAASQKMIFGKMPISAWRKTMEKEIQRVQIAAFLLANGGYASMTEAAWRRAEMAITDQMHRLERFVEQIKGGTQRLDGTLQVRAKMYVNAAYSAFESERRRGFMALGMTQERRVLGEADIHCPDCVEYASRGWVEIGTLPPIGDSACKTNCRCHFEFR